MSHYRKKNPPQRRKLTEKELELLEYASSMRVPTWQIADSLGISKETLEEVCKHQDAARNAVSKGRAKATIKVRDSLFRMATKEEIEKERVIITVDENGKEIKRETKTIQKRVDPDMRALQFWCQTQEEGFEIKSKLEVTGANGDPIKIEQSVPRETLIERIKNLKDAIEDEE